jgi:hypothetical protein
MHCLSCNSRLCCHIIHRISVGLPLPIVKAVRRRLYRDTDADIPGRRLVCSRLGYELHSALSLLYAYAACGSIEGCEFFVSSRSRADDDDIECDPRRLNCLHRKISSWDPRKRILPTASENGYSVLLLHTLTTKVRKTSVLYARPDSATTRMTFRSRGW